MKKLLIKEAVNFTTVCLLVMIEVWLSQERTKEFERELSEPQAET